MSHIRQLPKPAGAYSLWRSGGGMCLITSGQVGVDPSTGAPQPTLVAQVEQAIDNLEAVLQDAGAALSDVVKTSCFLADISQFATFDAVYRARFAQPYPARSTTGVTLAGGLLFEIEAVARRPESAATDSADE